jgi:hypothetical protein
MLPLPDQVCKTFDMGLFGFTLRTRKPAELQEIPAIVAAYLRDGRVYMHPYTMTVVGLSVFTEPVVVMDETDGLIGEELLALLSAKRFRVPHPKSWNGFNAPLLKAANARSFNVFAQSARYVRASVEKDDVCLQSTKNGGAKHGFTDLIGKKKLCRATSPEVREALRVAFSECE